MEKLQSPKILKKQDGEPISRNDLQFELLASIFSDKNEVFPDPSQIQDDKPKKVTFGTLYINNILNSPKASKILKDKMLDSAVDFATHFAMLSLLINLGRINTTMSFFHEMKTAIRTYHPIPALQRTTGNLQDAPRLKSILKAVVYGPDTPKVATTLRDCRSRIEEGISPPTHIANLIFILANESLSISKLHFSSHVDFLDLFTPVQLSSNSRARMFLWLPPELEEKPAPNPFSDPARPGEPPPLDQLTEAEAALENVDPPIEKAISDKLVAQRMQFLAKTSTKGKSGIKDDESIASVDSTVKAKGKRRNPGKGKDVKGISNEDESLVDQPTPSRLSEVQYRPSPFRSTPLQAKQPRLVEPGQRYSPYARSFESHHPNVPRVRPRTLLEHAWHVVACSDPLADSDDEMGDEHCRADYVQRLNIVCRLRGKDPTPEPE
ncbi:hypothetical protein BDP27DRAFT_1327799 [Rhodocollybia butyracea]|uniref:Uncharacterized protein n=1 Tax=Rhodocollybia butyracea TaxID=206335 RepID=A0A9P5PRC7_9AGAR|nr:hypothetical protein BDP27DRAFT_1327799 [Rhodocollybia butyracea]